MQFQELVVAELSMDEMQVNAGRATTLLKSMANESRLMILCQLSQKEMTVGELAEVVPLSQSALSQHLSVLRRDNLVKTRKESQFVWYSLVSDEAHKVIQTLYDLFCAPGNSPA